MRDSLKKMYNTEEVLSIVSEMIPEEIKIIITYDATSNKYNCNYTFNEIKKFLNDDTPIVDVISKKSSEIVHGGAISKTDDTTIYITFNSNFEIQSQYFSSAVFFGYTINSSSIVRYDPQS